MRENDYNVDRLFEAARKEAPQISFENVESVFNVSVGSGVTAGVSFWKQLLTLKKGLIMLGLGGITVLAIMALQPTTNPQIEEMNSGNDQQFKMPLISDVIEDNMLEKQSFVQKKDKKEMSAINLEPEIELEAEKFEEPIPKKDQDIESKKNGQNEKLKNHINEANLTEKQVTFSISNKTTRQKINSIQTLADQAGVDLTYKMGGKPLSIRQLTMKLKSAEEQSKYKTSFSDNFELNIGWVQDENGIALKLYNDVSHFVFKEKHAKEDLKKWYEKEKMKLVNHEPPYTAVELVSKLNALKAEYEAKLNDIEGGTNEMENHNEGGRLFSGKERASSDEGQKVVNENLKRESFIISNNTSEADILEIQKKALAAGIDFTYTGRFKKDRIKSLHIAMYIYEDDESRTKSVFNIYNKANNSFSYNLSWRTNESGQAVDFDGKELKSCSSSCR